MYSWQLKQDAFVSHQAIFGESNHWISPLIASEDNVPESIQTWLGRLCLLYGLPFDYLVPEEGMLPAESIRFFYIDPNWIKLMLDGAASIGRMTTNDLEHDQGLQDLLYSVAMQESQLNRPVTAEHATETVLPGVRTGLLLRSALVRHWPGLQVKAFPEKGTPSEDGAGLPILRMEQLAGDTLLCIFEGVFQRVEIHEPADSVHFGADREEDGYSVQLRNLGNALGELIPDQRVSVPMRVGARGVVDVERLAGLLKDQLTQATGYTGEFTSAELAVQMIEGVDRCVFENNE
jgi:hypothetical protein